MDHRNQGIAIIIVMIALSLVFQVQMKIVATTLGLLLAKAQTWHDWLAAITETALSWRALGVMMLAASVFILWLLALARLELSFALPIASIALVVTAVGGGLWLGESLSWVRILGLITTAAGIALVISS